MLKMEKVIEKTHLEVSKAIRRHASKLPVQEKEELSQRLILTFIEKFVAGELDAQKNWEGYVAKSVKGYVKNYKRDRKNEMAVLSTSHEDFSIEDLSDRVNAVETNQHEAAHNDPINWELLERLASVDGELKAYILFNVFGFSLKEINEFYGLSSEKRIADLNYQFHARLTPVSFQNPNINCRWFRQTLFALGISRLYGLDPVDQGLGWKLERFSFNINPVKDIVKQETFSFMSEPA